MLQRGISRVWSRKSVTTFRTKHPKGDGQRSQKEKNRDRIETRTAYTVSDISWLFGKEKWKNLACIGAIRTEVEKNGGENRRMALLYLQPKLSAEELLHHARMEWDSGDNALDTRRALWRGFLQN